MLSDLVPSTLDAFLDDQAVEVNSRDGSVYSGRGVGSQDEDAYDCGDSFMYVTASASFCFI